ncbi:hypothetical protein ACFLQ9_02100, partial [Bacteroidota bacterium]
DANGRRNTVNTVNTTSIFNTNNYEPDVFMIIEATSLNEADFSINDCNLTLITAEKWKLTCTVGTAEIRRSKMLKILFWGTDGTNARITSTYISGLTALKTSVSRDVGKRMYKVKLSFGNNLGNDSHFVRGTASNTTDNLNMSFWIDVAVDNGNSSASYQNPEGTQIFSSTSELFNTFGTDMTAYERSNPSSIIFGNGNVDTGWPGYVYQSGMFLVCGSFSWETSSSTAGSFAVTDYYIDESIPLLTATSASNLSDQLIYHNISSSTFTSTISTIIGVPLIKDLEEGANLEYKITNDTEDSGWLNTNEVVSFTAFTSHPTTLIIKLVPKTTNPTIGIPSLYGFYVQEY